MANADFDDKKVRWAVTTQRIIEQLVNLSQESARIYAQMGIGFSYSDILRNFIIYEADIRITIQNLVIAHFEFFPQTYLSTDSSRDAIETLSPSLFGATPISLLVNVTVNQTPSTQPLTGEKTSSTDAEPFQTLLKPTLKEPKKSIRKRNRLKEEAKVETLFNHMVELQSQLANIVTKQLEVSSLAFRESEKWVSKISLIEPSERPIEDKIGFNDSIVLRPSPNIDKADAVESGKRALLEEKPEIQKLKPKIARRPVEENQTQTLLQWITSIRGQLITRLAPSFETELNLAPYREVTFLETLPKQRNVIMSEEMQREDIKAVGLQVFEGSKKDTEKLSSETKASSKQYLELQNALNYTYLLPTLLLEAQQAYFKRILPQSTATLSPQQQTIGLMQEPSISTSLRKIEKSSDAVSALPASLMKEFLLPILESIRALSEFPVLRQKRASTNLATNIPIYGAMPTTSVESIAKAPISNSFHADYSSKAIQIPMILTQLLGSYLRDTPKHLITSSQQSARELLADKEAPVQTPSGQKAPLKMDRTNQPILNYLSEQPEATEENRYAPFWFIEELQKARTLFEELPELAISGPIRTTMLSELTAGVLVPSPLESELAEEPIIKRRKATMPAEPSGAERLATAFPEEDMIQVNILEKAPEEDLSELERSLDRIFIEQLADSNGPDLPKSKAVPQALSGIRTTELRNLDLQVAYSSLSKLTTTNENATNTSVFSQTINRDLEDLENKIRRILSAQISRYYGSSIS